MSTVEGIAAVTVVVVIFFVVFFLGYACGADEAKPLRDARGRFAKRYW